eukprot:NODE_756_length_1928_cov_29.034061_g701_i0.p3 GENE.NODE_756_length_1928_cov_29.034061_g701_i0~~NODE_756_length_1928_cov_29.034061_g701_i0.p3  ORF type:complete len:164 (+),score=23.04 NODE_756_length_1928_cov_29.034061_g701_i0:287-778(+)
MNTPGVEYCPRVFDIGNGQVQQNIVLVLFDRSHELLYVVAPHFCNADAAFPRNVWKRVAVIHSGGTAKIYIDGVEVKSCSAAQPPAGPRSTAYVARSHWSGHSLSKIRVRELAMWDRVLTLSELAALQTDANAVGGGVLLRAYCETGALRANGRRITSSQSRC